MQGFLSDILLFAGTEVAQRNAISARLFLTQKNRADGAQSMRSFETFGHVAAKGHIRAKSGIAQFLCLNECCRIHFRANRHLRDGIAVGSDTSN